MGLSISSSGGCPVRRRAHRDPITGLPDRWVLTRRLCAALRAGGPNGVLMVAVTATGMSGDRVDVLRRQVGARLRTRAPGDSWLMVSGAGEFLIFLPGGDRTAAELTAARLRDELGRAFDLDGELVTVRPSVGIACAPWHGVDPETLVRSAAAALQSAIERPTGICLFDPGVFSAGADQWSDE